MLGRFDGLRRRVLELFRLPKMCGFISDVCWKRSAVLLAGVWGSLQ